jgi:hypothetical protein
LAPLATKWGLDATIPEGADLDEYETICYPFAEDAFAEAQASDGTVADGTLAESIAAYLATPRHFYDVLANFEHASQRAVMKAWALLRESGRLGREAKSGRYVIGDGAAPEAPADAPYSAGTH